MGLPVDCNCCWEGFVRSMGFEGEVGVAEGGTYMKQTSGASVDRSVFS
jgi:hypothetical protein